MRARLGPALAPISRPVHHARMFVSHRHRGRDRLLWLKLVCLVAGAVVGLIGMRRDSAVLIDVAIVVVLVGFALRFVRAPVAAEPPEETSQALEPRPPTPEVR